MIRSGIHEDVITAAPGLHLQDPEDDLPIADVLIGMHIRDNEFARDLALDFAMQRLLAGLDR